MKLMSLKTAASHAGVSMRHLQRLLEAYHVRITEIKATGRCRKQFVLDTDLKTMMRLHEVNHRRLI